MEIERVTLGNNHPDLQLTILRVAQVHQRRGELDEALRYFQEALELQRYSSVGQADYTAIVQTLKSIGTVYLQRGDAGNMMQCFTEALRILQAENKSSEPPNNLLGVCGLNFYELSKLHPEAAAVA